jgi:hypothetical protein
MSDDMEFEHECDGECFPSYRWSWWALPITLLSLLTGIFRAFQNATGELMQTCCAASNYEADMRDFQTAAAQEIESITEASDG